MNKVLKVGLGIVILLLIYKSNCCLKSSAEISELPIDNQILPALLVGLAYGIYKIIPK